MENSLLFGNGINLLGKTAQDWDSLLDTISNEKDLHTKDLLNTMIYEKIYLNVKNESLKRENEDIEFRIKNSVADLLNNNKVNKFHKELIELKFDHYLTTNYDKTFENTFDEYFSAKIEDSNDENIYSIRRHKKYIQNSYSFKFWKIHGDIDKPKTIKLGLDHYCGSIGKIDAYIKGNYSYDINEEFFLMDTPLVKKISNSSFDHISWIELFFNTNLHVIGLGLDDSETDLWWILNKRARFILNKCDIKNKIYFYGDDSNTKRNELLKSMNIEIIIEPLIEKDYESNHKKLLLKMAKIINESI